MAVAASLDEAGLAGTVPIVVDPVMVAESGAVLLDADARDALIAEILPRSAVATPNLPEARGSPAATTRATGSSSRGPSSGSGPRP